MSYKNILNILLIIKIILCCGLTTVKAQTISGFIRGLNNDTIAKASIVLQSLEDKGYQYTQSDEMGRFFLNVKIPAKYILMVKAIEYYPFIDTLDVMESIDLGEINLTWADSSTNTLSSITVTAKKKIVTHMIDRQVVDVQNSYLGKLPNVTQLLKQMPEIYIDESENISILGRSNIAVLINGVITQVPYKNIPIQNIDKIEIITNPSTRYEGNIEAAINIILKKGLDDGIQGDISVQYENKKLNNYTASGNLYFNKKGFNSVLNVATGIGNYMSRVKSDQLFFKNTPAYALTTNSDQRTNGYYYYLNWNASLNVGKNNLLAVNATWQPGHTPKQSIFGTNNFSEISKPNIDSGITSNVLWNYYTRFGNGGVSFTNKGKHLTSEARLDFYWQDDGTNTENKFTINNMKSFGNVNYLFVSTDQYRKSTAWVPSVNFQYTNNKQQFDFGAKYYYIKSNFDLVFSDSGYFSPTPRNFYNSLEEIYASYANYTIQVNKFNMQLGIRGEYSSLKGKFNDQQISNDLFKILPSVQLLYQITDNQQLNFSYSQKINRVPFSRLAPLFYYSNPFLAYQGNPLLQPQVSDNFQLKYVFKRYYITGYYNNFKNALGQLPFYVGNSTILKFANYARVNFGAIVDIPVKINNWWSSKYNFRIYHQKQNGELDNTSFSTKNWVSAFAVNENFKLQNDFSINLSFNYTIPYYVAFNRLSRGPNLDLTFAKSLFKNRFELILYFTDILNTYSTLTTKRFIDDIDFVSTTWRPERGANINLKYNFSKGRKTKAIKYNNDDINSRW